MDWNQKALLMLTVVTCIFFAACGGTDPVTKDTDPEVYMGVELFEDVLKNGGYESTKVIYTSNLPEGFVRVNDPKIKTLLEENNQQLREFLEFVENKKLDVGVLPPTRPLPPPDDWDFDDIFKAPPETCWIAVPVMDHGGIHLEYWRGPCPIEPQEYNFR